MKLHRYVDQYHLILGNLTRWMADCIKRFASKGNRFLGSIEDIMMEHRRAHYESDVQTKFRTLDHRACLKMHHIKSRQDTRFNSMLQEWYGGRRAIRTYLKKREFVNIRLPPLHRLRADEGERAPEPKPRARPNAAQRRNSYYTGLLNEMESAEPGQQPAHRTTKQWGAFAEAAQGGSRPFEHKRFSRAAK